MQEGKAAGRMGHAADRRWRSPDVGSVSLEAGRTEPHDGEVGVADSDRADGSRSVVTPVGAVRLNPVELANPALIEDPVFGKAGAGAYGGRGPRVEETHAAGRIDGTTGRWVRTGGGCVRWVQQQSEGADGQGDYLWRCVTCAEDDLVDDDGPSVEPIPYGSYSYLENDDGTVTLVAYEGDETHIQTPDQIDGKAVSALGASLFAGHAEIEEALVRGSVKVIDEHAFDGCTSLANVVLPDTLVSVGLLSFAKAGLKSLALPASVRRIGEKAFFHCKQLESVAFPQSLVEIGESAFAYSGLKNVFIPESVERLGFNAFDLTPAQARIGQGAIRIAEGNALYRTDGAGLYCKDELVELPGYVKEYEVAAGTRRIAPGACKRHPTLAHVSLPEGLVEIGDDAFCSNRALRVVDLPESLERIDERAFVDTSVSVLRISRNVTHIGADALLVQGEAQMSARTPLAGIDLDPENPVFYVQNGLLCERGTSPGGGDTCLLYVGPDAVVRIPDQVTTIAVMAFGAAMGVDELYVHDHVHSFCYGWLSMKEPIRIVHVDFGEPVDGCVHGDFPLPNLSTRFRYMTDMFTSRDGKTVFDFDYYDAWVTCSSSVAELAPAVYARMKNPVGMSEHSRDVYEGIFERKGPRICRYFAEHSNIEALEMLVDRGWVDMADIDSELDIAMRDGRPQATACLLEVKHRYAPTQPVGLDFSL